MTQEQGGKFIDPEVLMQIQQQVSEPAKVIDLAQKEAMANTMPIIRDSLRPYEAKFHVMYGYMARRVPNLVGFRSYNSTLQFAADEAVDGKITLVSMDPQQIIPENEKRHVRGRSRTKIPRAKLGCRRVTIATVPEQMLDAYRLRFLGFGQDTFVGLSQRFNPVSDFALGMEFGQHGRVKELLFQGTLTHGGQSVTYEYPRRYIFDDFFRTIEVREAKVEGNSYERLYSASPEGKLVPTPAEQSASLGIPVEEEIALMLARLPL